MLNTHRDTHTTTWMHKISQDLEFGQKGWKWEPLLTRTEKEENRGREGLLIERDEEKHKVTVGSPGVAGEGRSPAGERESPERRETESRG